MPALYQYLYVSIMAPQSSPTCVGEIVRSARAFNAHHSITGLLVFDGWRFCQYLEGPEREVEDLVGRIARDPRHHRFRALYACIGEGPRRFPNWGLGYGLAESSLEPLEDAHGIAALEAFLAIVPTLDLAPDRQ